MTEKVEGRFSVDVLTDEQRAKFDEFKKRVADVEVPDNFDWDTDPDVTYIRFINGAQYNVETAISMWRGAAEWFAAERPELVTRDQVLNELRTGKVYFHGHDKLGRPTLIVTMARNFPSDVDRDQFKQAIKYMFYTGRRLLRESGHHQYNLLFDREGFSRANFDLELFKYVMSLQNFFPERTAQIFVIKVDWLFHSIFAVVKVFIAARTLKKITLLKSWDPPYAELTEVFDDDQLLEFHGGTATFDFFRSDQCPTKEELFAADDAPLDEQYRRAKLAYQYCRVLPPADVQMDAYALQQQAEEGDNTGSQPWSVQVTARAKWEAYTAKKGMAQDEAKRAFIVLAKKAVADDEPLYPHNDGLAPVGALDAADDVSKATDKKIAALSGADSLSKSTGSPDGSPSRPRRKRRSTQRGE